MSNEQRRRRRAERLAAISRGPQIAGEPDAQPLPPDHPTGAEIEPQPQDPGSPHVPTTHAAPRPPAGFVTVDAAAYARLRELAVEPERLAAELARRDREQIVMAALQDGRIPPARRAHWLQHLEADPEGAAAALAELPIGLIPVGPELGHAAPDVVRRDDTWFPGT